MVSEDLKIVKIIDLGLSYFDDVEHHGRHIVPVRYSAPEVFDKDVDPSFKSVPALQAFHGTITV